MDYRRIQLSIGTVVISTVKRVLLSRCVVGLLFSLFLNQSNADTDRWEIFSLSLEEILHIEIAVEAVSKKLELTTDAPSVVTVMTSDEIALFGGNNLYEILGRFVGVQTSWRAEAIGRVQVSIRNDQTFGADYRHTLILLNGSPFNIDSYNGNIWNQAALASLPIEAVDRIELIRGPGSVLHGTTAFQGVINIVTRKLEEDQPGWALTIGRGSRDAETYSLEFQGRKGDFRISGYATALNSAGQKIEALSGGLTNPVFNESLHEDNFGILTDLRYRDIMATLWYGTSDQGAARRNVTAGRQDEAAIFNQRYFANMIFASELGVNWGLTTKITAHGFRNDLELVRNGPRILYEADEQSVELDFVGNLGANSQLLAGIETTHYSGETPGAIQPIADGWEHTWWSVYSQFDYQISDTVRLTLGGQYNHAGDNQKFVPKTGLIFNLNHNWDMKLLYGEAFRSPVIAETDANIPVLNILGNPDLKPELVATTDLQLNYRHESFRAALTLFHIKQTDLSVRVFDVSVGDQLPASTFQNEGSLTIRGIEFEGKKSFGDNWFVTGGLTYQHNREGSGIEDFTMEPDWEGRLGIGYTSDKFYIGIYDVFFGASQDSIIRNPVAVPDLNPRADGYHLVSINANLELGSLFKSGLMQGASFNVYLQNLLDKEVYLPSGLAGGFDANSVPSLGGRVVWAKFTIAF